MTDRTNAASRPGKATAWELYDRLIEGVPAGIAVRDYCLGTHWSYVKADCGMGISFTTKGGSPYKTKDDLRKVELRDVAGLAKSWCFEEASLGVAALNAWYSRPEMIDGLGALYDDPTELPDGTIRKLDAFEAWRPRIEAAHPDGNAHVVVVGHFPHVDRIEEYAQLTVLERNCTSPIDTPDPACEYVMPLADYAFITGVTIINKTCPRLLQLTQHAATVMTGPSVVMSPLLFEYGANTLAGSVVEDPEKVQFAVKTGRGQFFGEALRMTWVDRPSCQESAD
ncbi:hypothetical protein GMI70_05660 [Eggerthellaceae bacterium zg-893]|nr:hypothetical protein [Eggerthellaceae bacterium zg-893]